MDATPQDQANDTLPTLQPATSKGRFDFDQVIPKGLVIDDSDEAADQVDQAERQARALLANLEHDTGERYSDCTLARFKTSCQEQATAVADVERLARAMRFAKKATSGLVLFGPSGTGKDHLAIAAGRVACRAGLSTKWVCGLDLFARARDAITNNQAEESLIREMTTPAVLILSDPLPPTGSLTEFQSSTLMRIIDRRYRSMRSTWATINCKSRNEAEARMGAQLVDRLRHDALCIYCNWPSFRKPAK